MRSVSLWKNLWRTGWSLLFVSSLFRLIFVVYYRSLFSDIPLEAIFQGFLHGLRFDLAVVGAFMAITALLIAISRWISAFKYLITAWVFFCGYMYLFIMTSDLVYFASSRQRLGYEMFAYVDFNAFRPVFLSAFKVFPWAISFGILLFGVFAWRWAVRFARSKKTRWGFIPLFMIWLLCVIMIRGGFQRVPMRVSDSFISKYPMVNNLAMNPIYLAVNSEGEKVTKFFPDSEAEKTVVTTLAFVPSNPLSADPGRFPLLRCLKTEKKVRPKNVVILLMESWTGKFISPEFTPEFAKLKDKGIYFDQFFATGYRTTSGVFSVLTGVPDQVGAPVMRRPESGFNYSSISKILKSMGFQTMFIHGGALDFDNMANLMIANGFDKMVGREDFSKNEGIHSTWGVDDYSVFKRVIKELDQAQDKPFFAYVLSTSTHAPYDLYDPAKAAYKDGENREWQFLNSFRYSDWAIGEFFNQAKDHSWFKDTLFVLTADHTHHNFLSNDYDNQRVPLWFYAPAYLKPRLSKRIGSHTDIAPTVFSLMGASVDASFGQDLLASDQGGFAYWMGGANFGWVEDRFIVSANKDGTKMSMFDFSRQDFQNDLVEQQASVASDLHRKVLSFAQLSDELIRHNRVAPDKIGELCK